jgi:hypothetical protein
MSLVAEIHALAADLPAEPAAACRRIVERVRGEVDGLGWEERNELARAIVALRLAAEERMVSIRAQVCRLGPARRAVRGYGHLRPHTRMQRLRRLG